MPWTQKGHAKIDDIGSGFQKKEWIEWNEMINKDTLNAEIKNTMEIFKENLIIVVVLIFSFVYFSIQLYAWVQTFSNN